MTLFCVLIAVRLDLLIGTSYLCDAVCIAFIDGNDGIVYQTLPWNGLHICASFMHRKLFLWKNKIEIFVNMQDFIDEN